MIIRPLPCSVNNNHIQVQTEDNNHILEKSEDYNHILIQSEDYNHVGPTGTKLRNNDILIQN